MKTTYEIYAPELGVLHGYIRQSTHDDLAAAEHAFKLAKKNYLYVRMVKVERTTVRTYPLVRRRKEGKS